MHSSRLLKKSKSLGWKRVPISLSHFCKGYVRNSFISKETPGRRHLSRDSKATTLKTGRSFQRAEVSSRPKGHVIETSKFEDATVNINEPNLSKNVRNNRS